jgi:hypothetical protein
MINHDIFSILKTKDFIVKAKKIHGDLFDYSKVRYQNANKPVIIICPIHGEFQQRPSGHLLGKTCRKCSYEKRAITNTKTSDTFIEQSKMIHGSFYNYSKIRYVKATKPVIIICPIHGEFLQKPSVHLSGHKCSKCSNQEKSNNKTYPFSWFLQKSNHIHNGKYTYDTTGYKNTYSRVKVICKEHGPFIQIAKEHLQGKGCRKCSVELISKQKIKPFNIFTKNALQLHNGFYGYTESSYISSKRKVDIICPKHGVFRQTPNNHISQRQGCPTCNNQISKDEKDISALINELGFSVSKTRDIISPLEIDIYIPEKNLAIEYCGIYWHGERKGKTREYHLKKFIECQKLGIPLLTVYDLEYNRKPDVLFSIIKHRLGISPNKIHSRKCDIKVIKDKSHKDFFNQNHLHGNGRASFVVGAYYNDTLLSAMSFTKPRFSSRHEMEISRFCNKVGYNIPGIAGRLFSKVVNEINPKSVISYADLRYGTGDVYEKLGFSFSHRSPPNYWYFQPPSMDLYSRIKFQKHKLVSKGADPSLTEWEIMKNNGFDRIWDCGNNVWVWKNN